MKRAILAAVFAVFAGSVSMGQFTVGPKVGISASKLPSNFPELKEKAKANYQVGIFFRFGKGVIVQPEIMYATRSGLFQQDSSGLEETVKFKTLDIPFQIGFKFLDLKATNIRILTGPVASFVLDKEVKADELIQDPLNPDNLGNMIWGWNIGAGVDILFLAFDLRYQFGLNNIYNTPANETSYDMKNNQFVFSVGFKLL